MADRDHHSSTHLGQTGEPPRKLPDRPSGIMSLGPYRLLKRPRRSELAGHPAALGGPELDLLFLLTAHGGQIVSNEGLIASIRCNAATGKRRLKRHINPLRQSLSLDGTGNECISQVAAHGYMLAAQTCQGTVEGAEDNCALWDG
jgi:DNA-binding response OmpR family regulator